MNLQAALKLSDEQANAALADNPAVIVTAGAGSGKTRTLTGRTLALLAAGRPLRSLIAITFTEKAAREMRNRIRQQIDEWRHQPPINTDPALWQQVLVSLDSARIGTIHNLCAAILRAHPAEAAVDPGFSVLEENRAALLQSRAVEDALAWAVADPECGHLFGPLSEYQLRRIVSDLLQKRLDAAIAFQTMTADPLARWSQAVGGFLASALQATEWQQALADLAAVSARKPDDKLEASRQEVLARWRDVTALLEQPQPDWGEALAALAALRKEVKPHLGAKANWDGDALETARSAMAALRDHYEKRIGSLADQKKPPSWALDRQAAQFLPGLQRLFLQALRGYEAMKAAQQALDFDDLEALAVQLLTGNQAVRSRWRSEISAVLVDEFQDTNQRQRDLLYALTGFKDPEGFPGAAPINHNPSGLDQATSLFVVGDAKQSIYRFRGADVTVFHDVQADVKATGGLSVALDTTYRAHRPLVETLNALLAPILGSEDEAIEDFQVPFTPLQAYRLTSCDAARPPFVEFHLGLGENADVARPVMATGLAARLHTLRQQGFPWSAMALLFRAASGYDSYEDALERAGIPFVTVAGRGFYERPEVRDLLNMLAALTDPGDNLALAGLLRSPAFGLADASLYHLRWRNGPGRQTQDFWQALHDEAALAGLEGDEAGRARRAREIVAELHALAGRTSVADVLKRLLDLTHYRAALRLSAATGAERAWRNVDKLLADAHRSQLVGIPEFLEYVQNLRDIAARESEAPSEAGSAVQLMTIHRAKGLEFPVVVIADAAHQPLRRNPSCLLDEQLGPALALGDLDEANTAIVHRLALLAEHAREEAEERRLLYVAATRAQEMLLISGHCTLSAARNDPGKLRLSGWLKWLGEIVGLDRVRFPDIPTEPQAIELAWPAEQIGCTIYPPAEESGVDQAAPPRRKPEQAALPAFDRRLVAPLTASPAADRADDKVREQESDPPRRVWRVTPRARRPRGPAWVVGFLVHQALRRWRFPDQPRFDQFLLPFAVESGLADQGEIDGAIGEAGNLLLRLQRHPLYAELSRAERRHELPYNVLLEGQPSSGIIDLIARSGPGQPWQLYDFKTDEIKRGTDLAAHAQEKGYLDQMRAYAAALAYLLGQQPLARIVFLDAAGRVEILDL